MHSKSRLIKYFALLPILPAILLSACSDKTQADAGGAKPAQQQQQQLLEVSTAQAKSQNMNITSELAGRIEAKRVAQVRARVSGIVLKQVFKEGSEVKAGDTLFYIDPSQMHANLNSAKANLAKAQSNLDSVSLKVKRYKSLVDSNAISQQEYEDMLANQNKPKLRLKLPKQIKIVLV